MKKRVLALLLTTLLLMGTTSCASLKDEVNRIRNKNNLQIGLLLIQGEGEGHIGALKAAAKEAGIKEKRVEAKQNVTPENAYGELCSLAENGCNLIFALGQTPEDAFEQAATDFPEAEFFRVGSTDSSGAANLRNAFFDESQLRYAAGIAAGFKLQEMIDSELIKENEALVGFVASYPEPEAISAYTAFYLGIKSVCETAVMQVQYTYGNGNEESSTRAVRALVSNGCVLVSRQTETDAADEICRRNGVYFVGENADKDLQSDLCVASVKRDYGGVFAAVIEQAINGGFSARFICADADINTIRINANAFADKNVLNEAQSNLLETEKSFKNGTLNVFDTSEWTVGGEQIKTTVSDDLKEKYDNKEYINSDGYFAEYEFSAEPRFAFIIDGITQMNAVDTEEDLL